MEAICAIESRGLIFRRGAGRPPALRLVPLRKPGKLPALPVASADYELSMDTTVSKRAPVRSRSRVLIVDDVLATGGTHGCGAHAGQLGARTIGASVLIISPRCPVARWNGDAPLHALLRY